MHGAACVTCRGVGGKATRHVLWPHVDVQAPLRCAVAGKRAFDGWESAHVPVRVERVGVGRWMPTRGCSLVEVAKYLSSNECGLVSVNLRV